jgi:protoporphyrinogen oxidase
VASIVVVGGGLAGLACAWKLGRAGHDVELLERRRAAPGHAAPAETEEAWLRAADQDVLAAAATLAIPFREETGHADAFLCRGRFVELPSLTLPALLAAPGGSRLRRLRWLRAGLAPARRAASRPSVLAARDGASLEAVLTGALGNDPLVPRLAALAGLACGEAPARLSHATGVAALAAHWDGAGRVVLEGGLARLRAALLQAVKVRWGCEVVELETEAPGARVRYRTQGRLRSVLADAAVVALPATEALRCCTKLTPDERGFFESVESAPRIVARLTLERMPPGYRWHRLGFPAPGATIRSLAMARSESQAGCTVRRFMEVQLAAAPSRRLASAPDADVETTVLEALASTPFARLGPEMLTVVRGVSPRPLFGPGAVERIARFERRIDRSPRLDFAGRQLLGPGPGAAFTSGLRTATAVARALQVAPRAALE